MRRVTISCLTAICAMLAVSSAAGAVISATGATSAPRARLRAFVCQPALDTAARAISITAVMRPLAGTRHMSLRFDLLSAQKPLGPFSAIRGGDLGKWISPADPSLGQRAGDVWRLDKQVVDLPAPATYRFRVVFRWSGAHGRLLGEAVRDSPNCFQPELRPNLRVSSILVRALGGSPPQDRYTAALLNAGTGAAGSFEVEFTDGTVVKFHVVPGLAPHTMRSVEFVGPVCDPQAPPTITLDPNDAVDNLNPVHTFTVTCPAGSAIGSVRMGTRAR